jgi:hypothetical protein
MIHVGVRTWICPVSRMAKTNMAGKCQKHQSRSGWKPSREQKKEKAGGSTQRTELYVDIEFVRNSPPCDSPFSFQSRLFYLFMFAFLVWTDGSIISANQSTRPGYNITCRLKLLCKSCGVQDQGGGKKALRSSQEKGGGKIIQ